MSDWDIRGQDIDQQYATYCTRAFSDQKIWNLSAASTILESQIGCALYLTHVSTTTAYAEFIRAWAMEAAMAANRPQRRHGKRKVPLTRAADHIVRQAGYDGVLIAMFGFGCVPTPFERSKQFQVDREAYTRVRDAVGTEAVNLIAAFRHALMFMHGYVRDYAYEAKLKTAQIEAQAIMSCEGGSNFRVLASLGNYLAPKLPNDYDGEREYETSLPQLTNDRDFYDERYAARMRSEALPAQPPPDRTDETNGD